jgi:hypothetical protein
MSEVEPRAERIIRSLRARSRRKTIKELKKGLLKRYRIRRNSLKKKYRKMREKFNVQNI